MKIVYECSCYGEGIVVNDDPKEKEITISIWTVKGMIPTFKHRIRMAWHLLFKGEPWNEVLLTYQEAYQLGMFIVDKTKE